LFTSGFLNQAKNDSGPLLGLFGVFLNGSIVQFPTKTAAFQLLHNSPDTALDSVDVYINGSLADTSFAFRTATPATPEYAYATYDIGIAPKHSTSIADTFWHQVFTFQPDTFYIATIQGLRQPANYAANPNGISTSFNVLVTTPAEYTASSNFNFDFFMVNGIPDAGAAYLTALGGPVICDSVLYDAQTGYVSLPAESFPLTLSDSTPGGGGATLGTYFANFAAFTGQSGVVLASGFLNPSANGNGSAAALYMSPIAGGPFIPLFIYTSIKNVDADNNYQVFPNPASNTVFVHTPGGADYISWLRISDAGGRTIRNVYFSANDAAQNQALDISDLSNGLYLLQINSGGKTANYRLAVVR
jgi:Secretion system C-terminal sorting domain